MKVVGLVLALMLWSIAASSHGAPPGYAEANVANLKRTSDVTVLVRISGYTAVKEIREAFSGRIGYVRFRVTGHVVESFHGSRPGPIDFYVVQEQPSNPPASDEYIVSLNRRNGSLEFADDSVWWVPATPKLVAIARKAR